MDLDFTDVETDFQTEVRAFLDGLFPAQSPYRETAADKARWRAALLERSWAAFRWPVRFGGPDWTPAQKFIWERETTARNLPPQLGGMGMGMLAPILFAYGTEDQQARFLPDIIADRTIWCQGYSEPEAGSDLASLRTRAERRGDVYVVDGGKIWTSGAHHADWMFCLTRTQTEVKPQVGITFLLIDMRSPGVNVIPIISLDGQHRFNRVTFDAVEVPVANRIGEEGQGWTYAKGLLTHERTGQAFVSMSLRMLGQIRKAASEIPYGDSTLMRDPGFAGRLALAEIELKALEMTEMRTLWEVAAGDAPGAQSSLLKLKGTEIVQRVTEFFVEIAGDYAIPWLPEIIHPGTEVKAVGPDWAQVETLRYFEARSASIAGGTDEVQRNIISKHVLKL